LGKECHEKKKKKTRTMSMDAVAGWIDVGESMSMLAQHHHKSGEVELVKLNEGCDVVVAAAKR